MSHVEDLLFSACRPFCRITSELVMAIGGKRKDLQLGVQADQLTGVSSTAIKSSQMTAKQVRADPLPPEKLVDHVRKLCYFF